MNNFVEPILKMWRTGSPDPTVYSGYPGFFNWIAFLPVLLGQRLAGGYGAYVGGRALVACFGVANVWLTYRVCRAFVGPGGALLGAALMAVSRGPVRAAHAITPDVLVATATLALLLVVQRATARRDWVGAGVLCGLATAVKYTGLLTLPILLVGLWTASRSDAGAFPSPPSPASWRSAPRPPTPWSPTAPWGRGSSTACATTTARPSTRIARCRGEAARSAR